MKSRSFFIVVTVSLAVTLCFTVTYSGGQIGGHVEGPFRSTSGLELIDDLPRAKRQEAGRFQVVTLINHTLLLDTQSGDTWVLTENPQQEDSLSWARVPRIRQKQKAAAAEPDPNAKPKPQREVDPFG